ncbi:hypothetical protein IMSAGC009_02565 [Lachnospiraceae bacterium]|nr:hypothetical protein IMSAGC009_02565 [Lachnospiraceae bacterium]
MREQMEQAYESLLKLVGIEMENNKNRTGIIIKNAISDFVHKCKNPAVWCYGIHTHMLMADYIFEMKNVKYIVDEFCTDESGGGFEIIRSSKIDEKSIDGIIISTFKYRKDITQTIQKQFPNIKYLDIYQILHEQGIDLDCEYYAGEYPYAHYGKINELIINLTNMYEKEKNEFFFESMIKEFILIKDFQSAISCMEAYIKRYDNEKNRTILNFLHKLYDLELDAASRVSDKNVLMLCMDGLRRIDLYAGQMNKLKRCIEERAFFFSNAYSVSTSTYESLIPAYSENSDLRTKYYKNSEIEEERCRFIKEAVSQNRKICFYTDCCSYVKSRYIKVTDKYQTAAEKIWDFLLDAVDEENGLFYIHILYESHFSYPNPYTKRKLALEGGNILFDFLQRNGGRLRTDYIAQHNDAVKYLDDLVSPFLEKLSCGIVMFADHGNLIMKENTCLEDVTYPQITFGEELIQVPLAVWSKKTGTGTSNSICSIMDLNAIIIRLMKREEIALQEREFVKIVRSKLYNADFKYLYRKLGYEQGLRAFETFVFREGFKLVVYDNGVAELYEASSDKRIDDTDLIEKLFYKIKDELTVCVWER